jgi:hypothetical protein
MNKTPWIVIEQSTMDSVCTRCGEREHQTLPAPIKECVKAWRHFIKKHRHCVDTPAANNSMRVSE